MSESQAPIPPSPEGGGDFQFLQPRAVDTFFEGRDPRGDPRSDPYAGRTLSKVFICLFLFVCSLGVYLATMSWAPFPGLPTASLLKAMKVEPIPGTLDLMWGWAVRVFDRMPGPLSVWMGSFSALCGALAVTLFALLQMRVCYVIRNEPGPQSLWREAYARRLSGLTAGLFLAFCIPFWTGATRSLPGTFHILMLVMAAMLYSHYQHRGYAISLFLMSVFYGFGMTEFPTFIVFFIPWLLLTGREMLRWQRLRNWRHPLTLIAGLLLGMAVWLFNAWILYRRGLPMEIYASPWEALLAIWGDQMSLILNIRFHAGFFVIHCAALVPWFLLFVLSRRSPWFFEWGQVLVRLLMVVGLLGVTYNLIYSPWRFMGLDVFMLTPYLFMAISFGYMTGEFFVMGERNRLHEFRLRQKIIRNLSTGFALLLPVLLMVSIAVNWRAVDGRDSEIVDRCAESTLLRLDNRNIIFSSGLLDDAVRLKVWERRQDIIFISASRIASPVYLKSLAQRFFAPDLRGELERGRFESFLETLMMSEGGTDAVGVIDMPDLFREFGYLIPNGFVYHIVPDAEDLDWDAILALQRPFWEGMAELRSTPVNEDNLVAIYQNLLCRQASKGANNIAIMLLEAGRETDACEVMRTAWGIDTNNISVLLNLRMLSRSHDLQLDAALDDRFSELTEQLANGRWGLARNFGYVWKAREWAKEGYVWAISGEPIGAAAARFRPEVRAEASPLAIWLDMAYARWGVPLRSEMACRNSLLYNEKDTDALLTLARHAMRNNDPDIATAYLTEALAMGLPEEEILFDRAMLLYVRGETEAALHAIENLVILTPKDFRARMAILLLTDENDIRHLDALKALQMEHNRNVALRLTLARYFMEREQWENAHAELEKGVLDDEKNLELWEMMGEVAYRSGNQPLLNASLRALKVRNPNHYLKFQSDGLQLFQQGDLAGAEEAFRMGIRQKRDPILLNNLAHLIMMRNGDLFQALNYVNEAIKRDPHEAGAYSTRAAIRYRLGLYEEAKVDLLNLLRKKQINPSRLLLLTECYVQLGDIHSARRVAKTLTPLSTGLAPDELERFRQVLQTFDGP